MESTAQAVAAGGVETVSLRALAASAQTSTNAVYALFGSRDGLLSAVMAEAVRSFTAAQGDVPATVDAVAELLELGRAYRRWALAHPSLYAVMFGDRLVIASTDECQDRVPDSPMSGMQPMVDVIERGAATGVLQMRDPIVVAVSIWASVHGFVSLEIAQWSHSPRAKLDALYEEHLEAVVAHWAV